MDDSQETAVGNLIEKPRLTLGFIPLTDCAPLVIALEKGHFRRHGLDVVLSRQPSWAAIRDKVAAGMLDGAHMLAPMPIATTLGLGGVRKATIAPMSLDLNGNAVTVSNALYRRLTGVAGEEPSQRPVSARSLRRLLELDSGGEAVRFATVFPFSSHNYLLRYWLAAAGVDPDRHVGMTVIPPPQMPRCLAAGEISGYCAGEPWNAYAVAHGIGRVLITDYEIWNNSPEKVLGVNQDWAERHPNTLRALLMALLDAAQWLDLPMNRMEAAALLASPDYVGVPADILQMSMTGSFQYAADEAAVSLPDFNVFHRYAATFPWRSHALWFLTQMLRWGQIAEPVDLHAVAEQVYRPDLYRDAAAALRMPCPSADYKCEGVHAVPWTLDTGASPLVMGPDLFFDGTAFDPADPTAYLAGFELHRMRVKLDDLARAGNSP